MKREFAKQHLFMLNIKMIKNLFYRRFSTTYKYWCYSSFERACPAFKAKVIDYKGSTLTRLIHLGNVLLIHIKNTNTLDTTKIKTNKIYTKYQSAFREIILNTLLKVFSFKFKSFYNDEDAAILNLFEKRGLYKTLVAFYNR